MTTAWSPCNNAIAFTRRSVGSNAPMSGSWTPAGATRRRLTARQASTMLLLVARQQLDRLRRPPGDPGVMGLTAMQARLTRNEAGDTPAWSPDGSASPSSATVTGATRLYVIPAAGGAERLITSEVEGPGTPAGTGRPRQWSRTASASPRIRHADPQCTEVRPARCETGQQVSVLTFLPAGDRRLCGTVRRPSRVAFRGPGSRRALVSSRGVP